MPTKTPGVYLVEKDAFPNSLHWVNTAVPAFIGYTETAMNGTISLADTPWRITSMAEFHHYFGGMPTPVFDIKDFEERPQPSPLSEEGARNKPELPQAVFPQEQANGAKRFELQQTNPAYALYGAIRLFFQNGGGSCYVTSIGSYADEIDAHAMLRAIETLKKTPEPNLLVIPETTRLSRLNATKVQHAMLTHCGHVMKNRFALLDISAGYLAQDSDRGDPVATFRDDIGINNLDFGAAYYPWLNTSIFQSRDFSFENINPGSRDQLCKLLAQSVRQHENSTGRIDLIERPLVTGDFKLQMGSGETLLLTRADVAAHDLISAAEELIYEVLNDSGMPGHLVETGTDLDLTTFSQADLDAGRVSFQHDAALGTTGSFSIIVTDRNGVATAKHPVSIETTETAPELPDVPLQVAADPATMAMAVTPDKILAKVPLYVEIMDAITTYMNAMSPGAAMAGLYTMVDNSRGVWKAPANISVNSVIGPMININPEQQENLNVSGTGKSINAILSFVGEGTLVWGARTLDGNSQDWRYISVRRTMISIEESIRLAVRGYVCEPNTATTWNTMRGMIENFLTSVWKQGGLPGATPADAFSVRLGLGETMTPDDIDEGILRIIIQVAVLRPAEFLDISFQLQMQKT